MQQAKDIKVFDDIKFIKDDEETFRSQIKADNGNTASIVYGKYALSGARHGVILISHDHEVKNDYNYEIMSDLTRFEGKVDCIVFNKDEVVQHILDLQKYKYIQCPTCKGEEFICIDDDNNRYTNNYGFNFKAINKEDK